MGRMLKIFSFSSKENLKRLLPLSVFVAFLFISQYVLPAFHKTDILFFSSWEMYSFGPAGNVWDISFDEGKTFLLQKELTTKRLNEEDLRALNYLLFLKDEMQLKQFFESTLRLRCQCSRFQLFAFSGNYDDYLHRPSALKKELIMDYQ
jgi:hypothetical protein